MFSLAKKAADFLLCVVTRLHAGFLNGGLLAILFPVLDVYTLPFEVGHE